MSYPTKKMRSFRLKESTIKRLPELATALQCSQADLIDGWTAKAKTPKPKEEAKP
jgi:hypothetical protein